MRAGQGGGAQVAGLAGQVQRMPMGMEVVESRKDFVCLCNCVSALCTCVCTCLRSFHLTFPLVRRLLYCV